MDVCHVYGTLFDTLENIHKHFWFCSFSECITYDNLRQFILCRFIFMCSGYSQNCKYKSTMNNGICTIHFTCIVGNIHIGYNQE